MKLRELFDKLGISTNIEDAVFTIRVNGIDKESFEEVPVLDFEIDTIDVRLENHSACEVVIYP